MISILFASHNGGNTLPIMLDAFCQLDIVSSQWEIIAVDNASTDNTAAILKSYMGKLPINYLYEATMGKNNALNVGVEQIKGNIVVLTDDDIIPAANWLTTLIECLNNHPEHTIFGGAIKPFWLKEPQRWILEQVPLGVTYGITDEGIVEGNISPTLVWGPNMAVRKSVFDEGFRFNSTIGPNGKNYPMGGETDFLLQLSRAGKQCWFCNNAVVHHIIRPYQLELKWIMGRAFRSGRGAFRREYKSFDASLSLLFGAPRWMYLQLILLHISFAFAWLRKNLNAQFSSRWRIQFIKGYIYEAITFRTKK